MRAFLVLALFALLTSCGIPGSRDAFFETPETKFLENLTQRLAHGEVDAVAADMYDTSNPDKNHAELERLAQMLEGFEAKSEEPVNWSVHKLLGGLRVVRVAIQYGHESGRWFVMSGEFVGPSEQLKIASYRFKEIEFPMAEANALTLKGKGTAHYVFMVLLPLCVGLSLFALWRCIRTRGLKRKWLWIVFIVLGVCTFTLDWTTGATEFQPVSFLVMSGAFARDGWMGPWTFEFALPLGALLFLMLHGGRRRAEAQVAAAPADGTTSG